MRLYIFKIYIYKFTIEIGDGGVGVGGGGCCCNSGRQSSTTGASLVNHNNNINNNIETSHYMIYHEFI